MLAATAAAGARIALPDEVKESTMKGIIQSSGTLILALATLGAAGAMAGCHAQHPDRKAQVYQALSQHEMASVEVYEDRNHGVITLKGIVGSANNKTQASQLVEQAAPGYRVDNQLTVDANGLMGLANPNSRPPEVEQMAHPPGDTGNQAPQPQATPHR